MKDCREEWYDKDAKVAVTIVDVTSAAQELARGHLAGPTSTHFLTEALASVALLGAEMSETDETVILQMKCKGPLGGFNVECTSEGTLRGYAEKKVLDDFDGLGKPDARKVIGAAQYQVTRSVPGRILSQGISTSIDGYLAGSLQRKACIRTEVAVSDEVEVLEARGVMVEILPDSKLGSLGTLGSIGSLGTEGTVGLTDPLLPLLDTKGPVRLSVASRNILKQLGLEKAELRKTTPLSFACRCSSDRALAMLAALDPKERESLPPTLDVTCHMCGRIFTVKTR